MAFKQVWHGAVQQGTRDEVVRVLRDEVLPTLRQDPDFIGCRLFFRRFGPDFGFQMEFEYRTLAGAAGLTIESAAARSLPAFFALFSAARADLLIEADL